MKDNPTYADLNELQKLAMRNALLSEYLYLGSKAREMIQFDLEVLVQEEAFEAAALYRDLLNDLDILDELAGREL